MDKRDESCHLCPRARNGGDNIGCKWWSLRGATGAEEHDEDEAHDMYVYKALTPGGEPLGEDLCEGKRMHIATTALPFCESKIDSFCFMESLTGIV